MSRQTLALCASLALASCDRTARLTLTLPVEDWTHTHIPWMARACSLEPSLLGAGSARYPRTTVLSVAMRPTETPQVSSFVARIRMDLRTGETGVGGAPRSYWATLSGFARYFAQPPSTTQRLADNPWRLVQGHIADCGPRHGGLWVTLSDLFHAL